MKHFVVPVTVVIVALVVEHLGARSLARDDFIEELLVRGRWTEALLATCVVGARAFALFVAPGWLLATAANWFLMRGRRP